MNRFIVISVLLLLHIYCHAQITFQKTYGGVGDDVFNCVQQTFDGGYIMAGYTNSFGAGSYDVYLVKTDSLGDTLWTRTYGGTGDDYGYFVQQTSDSGFIIIGNTQSFEPPHNEKAYLIKTNNNGDTLWTKTYWSFNPYFGNGGRGMSVCQTFDGGYILNCGASGNAVLLLIKTNSFGDTLWTKDYGIAIENYYYNACYGSIQQTADSGYIVTNTTEMAVLMLKMDVNGNLIWKRSYSGYPYWAYGFAGQQTPDGGYVAVGYINDLSADIYLIKTNSLGDTLWTKSYGGDSIDWANNISVTNDSGYIIVGYTKSFATVGDAVYLIKTDYLGNILWANTFGGINIDEGYSVQQTNDGGYIVSGATSSFGAGSYDGYLIKTDGNGNSGCNEHPTATIIRPPPTIVNIPTVYDTLVVSYTSNNSYPSIISNGGAINTLCLGTSINEIREENVISIYPNPANDNFLIKINAKIGNANLEIYNIMGEKIYIKNLDNNSEQEIINCKEFLTGFYFVLIRTNNKIMSKKLIIN